MPKSVPQGTPNSGRNAKDMQAHIFNASAFGAKPLSKTERKVKMWEETARRQAMASNQNDTAPTFQA